MGWAKLNLLGFIHAWNYNVLLPPYRKVAQNIFKFYQICGSGINIYVPKYVYNGNIFDDKSNNMINTSIVLYKFNQI